ncbi:ATP-dependent zinc protease [Sphingomicrobium nitratireducens]|uniref:ATP-dependent zinc protease family protein n=1 Tax=Sphingomicrobium nitratireducens TaxID=2964666 RepID=UPI0022402AE4|nr:RimK/LysX family protein [Sphingomicrobium nitratireducens]
MLKRLRRKPRVGWREWVALPDLGVEAVKAKIDTGARTSAIHAFGVTEHEDEDGALVRFALHPVQRRRLPEVKCQARLRDKRAVRSSNGKSEMRYVIETTARIGNEEFPIELTLTNRDEMGFRMLLGREALKRRFLVDPGRSYLAGKKPASAGDNS